MSASTCKGCRAPIRWIGKHPVNPEKLSEFILVDAPKSDGPRITLVLGDGRVVTGQHATVLTPGARQFEGYVSHFATCSDAHQFRKGV